MTEADRRREKLLRELVIPQYKQLMESLQGTDYTDSEISAALTDLVCNSVTQTVSSTEDLAVRLGEVSRHVIIFGVMYLSGQGNYITPTAQPDQTMN